MNAAAQTSEDEAGVINDVTKLNKTQKLAIFLLMLAPENAAELVRNFSEEELETVSSAIAGLGMITREVQTQVVRELSNVAMKGAIAVTGGIDRARSILELGTSQRKASVIISKIATEPVRVEATQQLSEMEASQIFNLLRNETPQIIALVACYLTVAKTSELLMLFAPEIREQVAFRMASINAAPPDAFEKVIQILKPKLGAQQQTEAANKIGGVHMVGKVLNSMDKASSKAVLMSIQERNAEIGAAISQTMFSFEDLAALERETLQLILRKVEEKDLILALKAASEKALAAILGSLSKRAAENIREEMEAMGSVKPKEIEAAQNRITATAKNMEIEEGIDLSERRAA